MQKYLKESSFPAALPLFQFQNGQYLRKSALTSKLRYLLSCARYDPKNYASHSFRIAAVTTAAAATCQQVFLTGSFKPLADGLVTAVLGTSGLQTSKLPEEQE